MTVAQKLNLLHELANLTANRPFGRWTSKAEEVELDLASWSHFNVADEAYLSLPLPEKLTVSELKWVARVLAA